MNYYTSSNGTKVLPSDIPDGYLQNAIAKMEREAKKDFETDWKDKLPEVYGELVAENEKRKAERAQEVSKNGNML